MALADILDHIVAEAEARAQEIATEADKAVAKIEADKNTSLEAQSKKMEAQAEKEQEAYARKQFMQTKLALRSQNLQLKRQLIEKTLTQILEQLGKISATDYAYFIENLLEKISQEVSAAEIIPAKKHSKTTETALRKFPNLSLSKKTGDFTGGVKAITKTTQIDATFENLVNDTYLNQLENIVANTLFKI